MELPETLTIDDVRSFRQRVAKLRGRNWPLNIDLLMALLPSTEIAERAAAFKQGPAETFSYRDFSSMDLTGLGDASIALIHELCPDVLDWHAGENYRANYTQPEGTCYFAFDYPGVACSGDGWTFPAAILDALLSGLEWELSPPSRDEEVDPELQASIDGMNALISSGEDEDTERGN